jgi:hypothetical protein
MERERATPSRRPSEKLVMTPLAMTTTAIMRIEKSVLGRGNVNRSGRLVCVRCRDRKARSARLPETKETIQGQRNPQSA